MTDKPPPDPAKLAEDDPEAEQRFQATLGRLVNTPHQSRKQPKAPKGGAGKGE